MATKAHTHRKLSRSQRLGRIARTVASHWLLALLSHVIAAVVVETFIHLPCGR